MKNEDGATGEAAIKGGNVFYEKIEIAKNVP